MSAFGMSFWLWSVSARPQRVKLGPEARRQAFHVGAVPEEVEQQRPFRGLSGKGSSLDNHPYRREVSLAASHEDTPDIVRATSRAVVNMRSNTQTVEVGPVGIEPTTNRL